MPVVPFAEFRPDISDFNGAGKYTNDIINAFPRGDGYGPAPSLQAYTSTLGSACRGYFYAIKNDGTIAIFAGTSNKLKLLDNTSLTFSDVSKGSSSYSALSNNSNWQFAQFNKFVFATQQNAPLQVYSLTTSTEFSDAAGSPPQAAYISIINRFLILSGIASPSVYRVQWSGLNDVSSSSAWTSGVNSSDFQDFSDGGVVRGVAGGEFGHILQDTSVRRMTFSPGSPYVFGIERISQDDGIYAPYSLVCSGDRVFYISNNGFKMIRPGGFPEAIGKERVDRFFFKDVDRSNVQLIIGANDAKNTRVHWCYKSVNGGSGKFDKILCYDWTLDKWTKLNFSGDYMASLAMPGATLENVDSAYGSNIDTLTISSLDDITTSSWTCLSAFDINHNLGFFTGSNLEATLETGEQGGDGQMIYLNGARPITDASNLTLAISKRLTPQSATSYTTATELNTDTGMCPARVATRYARGKVTITFGTTWTFASGIEPEFKTAGRR